jgi:hypothetical protein
MTEHQSNEEFTKNLMEFNNIAIFQLLPTWCSNIADNLEIARQIPNLPERPFRNHDRCVVVAGAPNLTDEEILKLRYAKVDTIITNKNLERFVKLGVYPTYVCLLDANAISKAQFQILYDMEHPEMLRFFAAMTCYPTTLERMFDKSLVYGFNPLVYLGGPVSVSKMWEWMNDKQEFSHGGNVGTLAFDLAKRVGYREIGLLGYELCEVIDKSRGRPLVDLPTEFIEYPDIGVTVALPVHFKAYLAYLFNSIQEKKEGVTVTNLTTSPVLTHSPVLEQKGLDEFLKGTR